MNHILDQATNDQKWLYLFFYNNPEFENLNSDIFLCRDIISKA